MKKMSKEKLHLPKIQGITLRWLINIIGVIVVFFIIVFVMFVNLILLSFKTSCLCCIKMLRIFVCWYCMFFSTFSCTFGAILPFSLNIFIMFCVELVMNFGIIPDLRHCKRNLTDVFIFVVLLLIFLWIFILSLVYLL